MGEGMFAGHDWPGMIGDGMSRMRIQLRRPG